MGNNIAVPPTPALRDDQKWGPIDMVAFPWDNPLHKAALLSFFRKLPLLTRPACWPYQISPREYSSPSLDIQMRSYTCFFELNRPFSRFDHMVGINYAGTDSSTGLTYFFPPSDRGDWEWAKSRELVASEDLPLFWKSHCVTCVSTEFILYHETRSCKRPILQRNSWKVSSARVTRGWEERGWLVYQRPYKWVLTVLALDCWLGRSVVHFNRPFTCFKVSPVMLLPNFFRHPLHFVNFWFRVIPPFSGCNKSTRILRRAEPFSLQLGLMC